jgi:N utilization substance protein A
LDFFIDKTTTGVVIKITSHYFFLTIEKNVYGILNKSEVLLNENIYINSYLKVYVKGVFYQDNEPYLYLSRTCDEILWDLLSLEIPEINNNSIEIKKVVRNPGVKSKVVISARYNFDAIRVCLGINGRRLRNISGCLNGEIVDLILWDIDLKKYFLNMVSYVGINYIELDSKKKIVKVFSSEELAPILIGKDGININLLNKLTDWRFKILNIIY